MVARRNAISRSVLAILAGVTLSGCASESGDTTTATPAKIEGARSEAPPEAQAAMKQAQEQQRARADAQGRAYSQGVKTQ